MNDVPRPNRLVAPFPILFLAGLVLVNLVAIFHFDPLDIGAFFSFFYIIIVPGFLLLPFLVKKQLSLLLGLVFSVALSILLLMLVGLGVNIALPLLGMSQPLTTLPLLIAFDGLVYILLMVDFWGRKTSPVETLVFNARSWRIIGISCLLPVLACAGAISLNNGGANTFAVITYLLAFFIMLAIVFAQDNINSSVPPLSLYMMALSLLLMNSMRGWFVTGHDILLEYHVFTLVNTAHRWSMTLYQDPYMACLSITILPTYLQNLLHVSGTYIFKFFLQFIGAGTVVVIYYISKEYVSRAIAFLTALVYLAFPTFMTDMAFLNRQGIAFLFFGALIFILLTKEYFDGWRRNAALVLFSAGMILSHYSTSYVAVALFVGAYMVNRIIRFFMNTHRPRWFARLTARAGNKEIYRRPILLTLPFVLLLAGMVILWSVVITKTSDNLSSTLQQITANIQDSFNADHAGVDQYSVIQLSKSTPQELFSQFMQQSIAAAEQSAAPGALFPLDLAESYPTTLGSEPIIPLSSLGRSIETFVHINLVNFYNDTKQAYAYIMQCLLLIGLLGLLMGYSFKKNLLRNVPAEYVALSISGIVVLAGQTILPSSAVDYGLLRLFQQNLIFLGLPIVLGLLSVSWIFFRSHRKQLLACGIVFIVFFAILSGLVPEWTGGGRPALPLNDYGFYYDAYYTHTQGIASIAWLTGNAAPGVPVQADHYFSGVKLLAFGNIVVTPGLFPETIQKNSYVYLDYSNVKTGEIIEYAGADVVYYSLPVGFLNDNKNLVYNNGGAEIYH